MVKIKLRLVGEEENVIFPRIELDPQIQLYDLAKRIEWITWIPPVFQEVRFRSQDLPLVERPIQDIKFGEEIVVMHSDLPWWEQYKESADIALKPGCERLWQASEAVWIHKVLMEHDFFMVYCSFYIFQMENQHKIAF
ncbi:hypothetical protein B9Z55_025318 [Caenorhabditis nigoni]|uniref:Ubiquitin-like domain-containing protein n=1 Tax=Caenorhabditis nigoni TaxID=1611254 RepID=A0A2G5SYP4_9PELO|nr:hypothetical protein B9Z55_025318 [Caenorhabditis nigoni]